MRKLSVKMRVTIWYTSFMLMIVALVLFAMLTITRSTIDTDIRNDLADIVESNSVEVQYDNGKLKVDSDFEFYKDGVYSFVYDAEGYLLYGGAMYNLPINTTLQTGSIRRVKQGGSTFYIYDILVTHKKHEDAWVRGIMLADNRYGILNTITNISMIALPIIILLAAAGGYYIAKSAFRPVEQINHTVSDINEGRDLSKRIDVGEGRDEIHQLAANFNLMFQRLESSFETEKQFTADASHELRTPMATILAQCELVLDSTASNEDYHQAIQLIQRQANKMSGIITQLLTITRLDQHVDKLNCQHTDLSKLLSTLCEEYSRSGIVLHTSIQPGISANIDRVMIGSMLANLIQNAIKYGGENIHVRLSRRDGEICMQVQDDGKGIAAEHQQKIWHRFYQVDPSRDSNKDGSTGLGLAMVKQIAELHGGCVELESHLGNGSCFSVFIPE